MNVLIFLQLFFRNISHSAKNSARYDRKMHIGINVQHLLLLSDFKET
jgi:hypothetical protein